MNKTLVLGSIMSAGVLASSVNAATIQTSQAFSGFSSESFNLNLLEKFDSSLGTLTGVNVHYTITSSGGLAQYDNEAGSATGSIDVSHGVTSSLNSGSTPLVNNGFSTSWSNLEIQSSESGVVLGANDGDGAGVQSTGSDYYEFSPAGGTLNTNSDIYTGAIGAYAGNSGEYLPVITVVTGQSLTTTADGAVSTGSSPSIVNGLLTITYTYDSVVAVPEPSSTALLGLGGMALILRRRRS
ncbi:PEP-CTERM sorting domain-containing protein [Rubritalea spongiae]|uniref:PEP-CTERM sorting domain-containing protein n=1 Tax=Rubritalea spongiae TaxID=430797 RepID=A0ABW5E3V2_9BACT